MDWPQQALVSSAKIHVSYVKYGHNRSSEQLARQSKVTLKIKVTLELIRKIKRYRKCRVLTICQNNPVATSVD